MNPAISVEDGLVEEIECLIEKIDNELTVILVCSRDYEYTA